MLIYIRLIQSVTVKGEAYKVDLQEADMQPTPHAVLCNVGILNHMTL